MTETNILKAIDLYKKVGLFNKVSQSSIDSVLNDLKENPVYRYNELISRFTSISLTVDERFPVSREETIVQIKKMAQISDYAFDPKNIRFVKDSTATPKILFELKNKTYQENFYDPWMDPWRIINNAVFTELGGNRFEVLRFEQYKVTYVYLSPEQMKTLEKEKVIGDY